MADDPTAPPPVQSRTIVRGIKIELPSGAATLVIDLEIDCPICGQHSVRIAGHHARAIRQGLMDLIDLYPELTGKSATLLEQARYTLGEPPTDPSVN